MSPAMTDLLLLAVESEGIPADHIAAKIAVPLGILIFSGSVYLLLWSNYGAKKGAAIYGTAFFGFCTMIGVFWWFGAPGGLVAAGPRNFPGQAQDAYTGGWYAFEEGSQRAEFFPAARDPGRFEPIDEFVAAKGGAESFVLGGSEYAGFLGGIAEPALEEMASLYLPVTESGFVEIGANRRQSYQQAAGSPQDGEARADQFFTASAENLRVTEGESGTLLAAADVVVSANFVDAESGQPARSEQVDSQTVFAFRDPGAVWFPSAVWTGISLVLFLGSLFALDRLEQREKRLQEQVEEPEDLAVPIAQ